MKKVLLWGVGTDYNKNLNLIKYYAGVQFKVVGITARDLPNCKFIDGYSLIPIQMLNEYEFDYIIVMNQRYYLEILQEANLITGIGLDRIFPCRVLSIPYFDFNKLTEISEIHYSIISNNCWGGILCHTLGIESRSPFKNVAIKGNDFLKITKSFDKYMQEEPVFENRCELDTNSGKIVPVLKLGDVMIKCSHYPNPYEAIELWQKRKLRINTKALLFEMYAESIEIAREFDEIKIPYKKICFVPFETEYESCITLRKQRGQRKFYETVNDAVSICSNGLNYNIFSLFSDAIVQRQF